MAALGEGAGRGKWMSKTSPSAPHLAHAGGLVILGGSGANVCFSAYTVRVVKTLLIYEPLSILSIRLSTTRNLSWLDKS